MATEASTDTDFVKSMEEHWQKYLAGKGFPSGEIDRNLSSVLKKLRDGQPGQLTNEFAHALLATLFAESQQQEQQEQPQQSVVSMNPVVPGQEELFTKDSTNVPGLKLAVHYPKPGENRGEIMTFITDNPHIEKVYAYCIRNDDGTYSMHETFDWRNSSSQASVQPFYYSSPVTSHLNPPELMMARMLNAGMLWDSNTCYWH